MVNLKVKPYNLDEESIRWVEDTIANMSIEEKIGQLFVNMGSSRDEEYLKSILDNYHIGAVRYNPGKAEEVYEQNRILQENSKIPLLIAANTEMGGNGACTDGTYVGNEVKIAATQDSHYAYELGRISGIEASAIGCNWSFAPIVDINRNWRNPIISTRTWSADVEQTLELSLQYMKGIMESGILPAAKHFPGDGIDERDQHLSFAPNTLTVEEWDNTFGKVYSGLIEAGLPSIMAGHIALPQYVKKFNPEATIQEMNMPATLSKYVLTDLLKGQMGFNGLVVTDASHMVAMTSAMKRKDMLPTAIAAGSDLFLFFNDPDEDFQWMMEGYKNEVITEERLNDALSRILGLKASLGLHKKAKTEILQPKEEAMAKIGLEENKKAAGALNWAVNEMNKRYNLFSQMKVKNIESYNKLYEKGEIQEKLPYIVVIVDELADLMMACPNDVEDYICRLAQMARAAGMHLIIATQRPSVDVITGVIKANIPSRVSFAVSSGTDSRTILDQVGAEKLLGRGDMLYYPIGENKPLRVQGAFISEEEVENVVEYIKNSEDDVDYSEDIINHINSESSNEAAMSSSDTDELLEEAMKLVIDYQQASTSFIQRKLRVGFNRASRIMDELEEHGIISEKDGSRPRQVLVGKEDRYNE